MQTHLTDAMYCNFLALYDFSRQSELKSYMKYIFDLNLTIFGSTVIVKFFLASCALYGESSSSGMVAILFTEDSPSD